MQGTSHKRIAYVRQPLLGSPLEEILDVGTGILIDSNSPIAHFETYNAGFQAMAGAAGNANESTKAAKVEQDILPDCNEKYSGLSAGHSA